MSPGKFAFTPKVHAASLRSAVVSKCTTCPVPCTPASVRPAQKTVMGSFATWDGFVRHLRERLFQLLLHTADFILPLPAVIPTAVVLNAQRNFINWRLLLVGH